MTHEKHDSSGAWNAATATQKLPSVPDTEEEEKKQALEELGAVAAKKTETPQMALLPCPFCEGLAREDFSIHLSERSIYFAWVECENANSCGCSVRQFGNYDKEYAVGVARRAWNRRATPSVEPAGPKSSPGSEYSKTPTSLDTGGRNALNLQMALERLLAINDELWTECSVQWRHDLYLEAHNLAKKCLSENGPKSEGAQGMMEHAKCTLCAKVESPGFFTGCMIRDLLPDSKVNFNGWTCDGEGNCSRPLPSTIKEQPENKDLGEPGDRS